MPTLARPVRHARDLNSSSQLLRVRKSSHVILASHGCGCYALPMPHFIDGGLARVARRVLLSAAITASASCKSSAPQVVEQTGAGSAVPLPASAVVAPVTAAPKPDAAMEKRDPPPQAPSAASGSGSDTAREEQLRQAELAGRRGFGYETGRVSIQGAEYPFLKPRSDFVVVKDPLENVIASDLVVVGALDPYLVRRYLKRNRGKFVDCYEQRGKINVAKVTLHFVINSAGSVASADASGEETFARAVSDAVKTIEFPRPKQGEVDVTLTLDFSVVKSKK